MRHVARSAEGIRINERFNPDTGVPIDFSVTISATGKREDVSDGHVTAVNAFAKDWTMRACVSVEQEQ